MRSRRIAVALAAVLSVAACAGPAREPVAGPVPSASALPAGWRWESYGGIEVGVPAGFGYDNGSQRLGQWCVRQRRANAGSPPVVGRPGSATAACPQSVNVADTGPVVSLADGLDGLPDAEGDRRVG